MPGRQPFRPTLTGISPKSGHIPVNKIVNNTPTAQAAAILFNEGKAGVATGDRGNRRRTLSQYDQGG